MKFNKNFKSIYYLLIAISSISCSQTDNTFKGCLSKDYFTVIQNVEKEFKQKLEAKYNLNDEQNNLVNYLQDLNSNNTEVLKPSEKILNQLKKEAIIKDIWIENNTPNLNGTFCDCKHRRDKSFNFIRKHDQIP